MMWRLYEFRKIKSKQLQSDEVKSLKHTETNGLWTTAQNQQSVWDELATKSWNGSTKAIGKIGNKKITLPTQFRKAK